MTDETINPETVAGLANKLDELELTEAEQEALDTIFERAADADADVEGFGVVFEVETTVHGQPKGARRQAGRDSYPKLVEGLGFDLGRDSVWTDMRPLS